MIYIIVFLFSFFILKYGYKIKYIKGKKKGGTFWLVIGLMLPVLLAAFRDTSVGTDVEYYVVPYFNAAVVSGSAKEAILATNGDKLYIFVNFIISRFTSDIFWLFAIIELINVAMVFTAFIKMRTLADPALSMLYYYLLFYNKSLSTFRQSVACSALLLAVALIYSGGFNKKNIIYTAVLTLVAMGFHTSALIIILSVILMFFSERLNIYITSIVCLSALIPIYFFKNQLIILAHRISSHFTLKYTLDSLVFKDLGNANNNTSMLIMIALTIILTMLLNIKSENQRKMYNAAALYTSIVSFIMIYAMAQYTFISRLFLYFQMFWPTVFAQASSIIKIANDNKKSRFIINTFICILLIAYWYMYYVVWNICETIPYSFA